MPSFKNSLEEFIYQGGTLTYNINSGLRFRRRPNLTETILPYGQDLPVYLAWIFSYCDQNQISDWKNPFQISSQGIGKFKFETPISQTRSDGCQYFENMSVHLTLDFQEYPELKEALLKDDLDLAQIRDISCDILSKFYPMNDLEKKFEFTFTYRISPDSDESYKTIYSGVNLSPWSI